MTLSLLNRPPRAPTHFVSIVDLAKRLGVTARALRFYQDRGLIRSHRIARNMRAYDAETVAVVGTIVALRNVGLGVDTIGKILSLAADPLAQAKATRAALQQSRDEAQKRIARIDTMLEALSEPDAELPRWTLAAQPPARGSYVHQAMAEL